MCCPGMAPRRAQHTLWGNRSRALSSVLGDCTAIHNATLDCSFCLASCLCSPSSGGFLDRLPYAVSAQPRTDAPHLCFPCWAEAHIKIARMTLTIKLDGNWSSFQLANSAPPLSVTGSAIAPSARMTSICSQRHIAGGSHPTSQASWRFSLAPRGSEAPPPRHLISFKDAWHGEVFIT